MSRNPTYHEGMRELQDRRETRAIADRLEQVTLHTSLTEEDSAFIAASAMCFVATADAEGHPDCSYKGGLPGFVKVIDSKTLAIPDYDGNGMYRSWGNVLVNAHVGLLFIDFENARRIRVNGRATISQHDPLMAECPGATFVVRIEVEQVFPNCPRYIHKMRLLEHSVYAPRPDYSPPVPEWKRYEVLRDALPARDRED
ncbi:MAG: pyridoxamine 5'-phosphate oxidase family protein [Pseudomonadales bacterium]|nr:pyridoxamine 5'-phosphate oxidase family protein [Pseudomonadales bacterium]